MIHPETRSVQSTPADKAREGFRQYIEKEKTLYLLSILVFEQLKFHAQLS